MQPSLPSTVADPPSDPPAEQARRAVAVVFAVNGLAFASWASRTPAIKNALDLDASGLGLLLVCLSIGAMASMPLSGAIAHGVGAARAVLGGAVVEASGFVVTAVGLASGVVWLTGAGLFVAGLGISVWDVSMNVEGAAVERRLGRTIMARFHAAWSLGSVLGAGLGALAAAVGLGVSTQLVLTAVFVLGLAAISVSYFTPVELVDEADRETSRSLLSAAWTTPRTLIVGLMVLAFAFSEGVANDWTAVAVVEGLGSSESVGAIAFGGFVAAMTLSRLVGVGAVDRWGRVAVLRVSALVAGAGVLLVMLGPGLGWVIVGTVLWGGGTALGFPTGMSAAADHTDKAAIHVSVVASIGYVAFLAGPPLVGFLADAIGIRESLFVVLVAHALAFGTAGAARPLRASDPTG